MKEIKLTRGLVAFVDDEDYEWLNQWRWHAAKQCTTFYARRNLPYKKGEKRTSISMHRAIKKITHNDKRIVDHMDRNGLNNQRSNLRFCTPQQNARNRSTHKNCTYKGVYKYIDKYFKKTTKEWVYYPLVYKAKICVMYKQINLGTFKTEREAVMAYNRAAKKYHKRFAALNTYPV